MIAQRNKIALTFGEQKITYTELLKKITLFSELLTISPGDRVVLYSANRLEWIYAFYAIWLRGGIPVPVDFMASSDDIAFILQDCKPITIISTSDLQNTINESLIKARQSTETLLLDDVRQNHFLNKECAHFIINKNQTAVIIYTSGTTGSPKGVMLSFENLLVNINAVTVDVKIYSEQETVLMLLPLHHVFPLVGTMMAPLSVGASIAICPSLKPDDIIKTLKDHKVSIIISVPRFYATIRKGIMEKVNAKFTGRIFFKLAQALKSKKFSRKIFAAVHDKLGGHVKFMVAGGAALGKEVGDDFNTLGFDILEGYGMTEAAPMITFTRPGRYFSGSPGEILPGMTVEIKDGEIIAKGKNVMQGYYNRPEETAEIIKDGWLYTGDLGRLENNVLYITGRKKEILVLSSGKNINPVEIEDKILKMSAFIKELGVFLGHNILQAIVVPNIAEMKRAGIENYEEHIRWEVIDAFNKNASPYKKIMKFTLSLDDLPRTRLSKLQRFKLAEIAEKLTNKEIKDIPEPNFKEYLILKEYLQNETGNKVYAQDHLEMDVALDSLGKIALLVYIENNFGVQIQEAELAEFSSVVKIAEYISRQKTKSESGKINWSLILKEKIAFSIPQPRFMHGFLTLTSKIMMNLMFRLKGEGTNNLPEGACIIAPNHQSAMDGFFVAAFLRRKVMKQTYVYAKEKHWRSWWMKKLANHNNIILMDLNKDLKLSLQKMAAVLEKGKKIIIFPEGTRSKDGKIGNFKKTFAILSQELNIPIIPVAITGSFNAMPSGRWIPKFFSRVNVKFLQPVYPLNHSYDSLKDDVFNKLNKLV